MKTLQRGFLIAIEGIDGSGKSTLAANLFALANQNNLSVILTKEPGSTPLGKQLRQIVQTKEVAKTPIAEFLLFAADRAQHVHEVIKPALTANKLIITDRMADSSLVYQGYGRGLSLGMINSVNKWALDGIRPDLTIYPYIDIDTAWQRIIERNESLTAFEQEKRYFTQQVFKGFNDLYSFNEEQQRNFTQRLIDGFNDLYYTSPERHDVIVLDGHTYPTDLARFAWKLILERLPL